MAGSPSTPVTADRRRLAPRLRPPDGAPQLSADYLGQPPLAEGDFFPVAVWFESVIGQEDIDADRSVGLNTYLELTTNTDLDLVAGAGMRAVTSGAATDERVDGFLLPDEVDMWAGPGEAEWTGNSPGEGPICEPEDAPCGYTVLAQMMAEVPPERYVYGQFGKGVTMWESDAEARRFVNDVSRRRFCKPVLVHRPQHLRGFRSGLVLRGSRATSASPTAAGRATTA